MSEYNNLDKEVLELLLLKRDKEIEKLKEVIDSLGGIRCAKCGEYHQKHFVCWNCGYDRTKEEQ